ncbi:cytochrome P450 family protein [Mycobacterium xenopi 4042]|uniref:Cytochrome P450 family protein n=1 Tax=Mycobacterium xenopi 4042 TaxID=1299334 RepID=X8DF23_MYCXE|nr:cytochrome P450 family protein [Mycobacterium xenopi 4042]
MFGEIAKHIERRRSEGLGDDLFSDILRARLTEALDDTQITMYAFLMMLGGMDTTSGFTGNVLLRLCQDPLLRRQLIADPELIKKAPTSCCGCTHRRWPGRTVSATRSSMASRCVPAIGPS